MGRAGGVQCFKCLLFHIAIYNIRGVALNYTKTMVAKEVLARCLHRSLLHYAYAPFFKKTIAIATPLGLWCFVLSS